MIVVLSESLFSLWLSASRSLFSVFLDWLLSADFSASLLSVDCSSLFRESSFSQYPFPFCNESLRRFFYSLSNAYGAPALPVHLGKCWEHELSLRHCYAGVTYTYSSSSERFVTGIMRLPTRCPKQNIFGSGHTVQKFENMFDSGFLLITLFIRVIFPFALCLFLPVYLSLHIDQHSLNANDKWSDLRADVWNYRESGVSREISNFFIFCPSNRYNEVFSKITFKVSTAFYFFEIGRSLKIRHIGLLRIVKLGGNYTFLSRSYVNTQRRLLMKHKHNINTL